MNLHGIVRGAVITVAKDQPCELYTMTGKQVRDDRGGMTPVFSKPKPVKGQWQSLSADALKHIEKIEAATTTRRVYLFADDDRKTRPWAMWRPLGRSGDFIKDDYDQFWRIDAVIEDFSHEGWISVQATMLTAPVAMVIEGENDNPTS